MRSILYFCRLPSLLKLGAFATGLGLLAQGCAHAPDLKKADPKDLLGQICSVGDSIQAVNGTVWLKAKSSEASGQFPAAAIAKAPSHARLEVSNPLGGTEAVITVDGLRYRIEIPGKKARTEEGFGSWGGIPLRWATPLLLGRFPCPTAAEIKTATVSLSAEGELRVVTQPSLQGDSESFTFRFREWDGKAWAEALVWERKGTFGLKIDFTFGEPDARTGAPGKWEAKSARGDVKARWRDRVFDQKK